MDDYKRRHARGSVFVNMRVSALLREAAVIAKHFGCSADEFKYNAIAIYDNVHREYEIGTDREVERLEAAQFAVATGDDTSKGEPT